MPPYVRDSEEATLWAHLNARRRAPTACRRRSRTSSRARCEGPRERYLSAGDLDAGRSRRRARPCRAGADRRARCRGTGGRDRHGHGDDARLADLRDALNVDRRPPRPRPRAAAARTDGQRPARPALGAIAVVLAAIVAAVVALAARRRGTTLCPLPHRDRDHARGRRRWRLRSFWTAVPPRPTPRAEPTNTLAAAGGSVWITTYNTAVVARVDASSGESAASRAAGSRAGTTDITAGSGHRRPVSEKANAVTQVEASTGRVQRRIAPAAAGQPVRRRRRPQRHLGRPPACRCNRNPVPQILLDVYCRTGSVKATPVTRGIKDLGDPRRGVGDERARLSVTRSTSARAPLECFIKVQEGPIRIAGGAAATSGSRTRVWFCRHADRPRHRAACASRSVGAQPQLAGHRRRRGVGHGRRRVRGRAGRPEPDPQRHRSRACGPR